MSIFSMFGLSSKSDSSFMDRHNNNSSGSVAIKTSNGISWQLSMTEEINNANKKNINDENKTNHNIS